MPLGIPNLTKPNYNFKEDVWAENTMRADNPSEIVIGCPHKRHEIYGLLASPLKINGKSEWESAFGGGIMSLSGSVTDIANQIMQFGSSVSIQQPWMNRKTWKTTAPFTFQVEISFVATDDEKKDVWDPCVALMSFIYPREIDLKSNDKSFTLKNWTDSGALGTNIANLSKKVDNGSVLGAAMNMTQIYQIPGPGIQWSESRKSKSGDILDIYGDGDPVYVHIGNMIVLNGVYIENIDIQFSNAMGPKGYPLAAKASVGFSMMDACYVTSEGNLMGLYTSELGDSTEGLSDFVNSLKKTAIDFVEGMTKAINVGFSTMK